MPSKEKTYLLRHTPEGLTLVRNRDSDHLTLEDDADTIPALTELQEPRWDHWYQRKLARPWQATLLGMNIEPIKKARQILRTQDSERYQAFQDRLDILQTLMGLEVSFYEDHVREGDGVNEKYIELAEYYRFAERLKWAGVDGLRIGLRLDHAPPVLNSNPRQTNNLLGFLDLVLANTIGDYLNERKERSPAAVLRWLNAKGEISLVSDRTLSNWFSQMSDLESKGKRDGTPD
ncbi:MAG: hypothetical protein EAZ30_08115 [Betaproteobacteria bacterium]|nr:MAG: hypothetical protein EAZ30_08115 [Betaproteobacteria bacterium]